MQPINTKREHANTFSFNYNPESPVSHLLNNDILSSYPPYLDNINTQFNFQQQANSTSPFSADGIGIINAAGNNLMVNTDGVGSGSGDLDIFMMDDLSLDPSSPFDNRNNPPTLSDDTVMMDYGIDPKTINPYMSSQQSFEYQTSYSSSLSPPLMHLSSFQSQHHPHSAYPSSVSRHLTIPPPSFSKRPSYSSTDDLFSESHNEEGSKPIPIPSQPISFTSAQRPSTAPVSETTDFSPTGSYSCVCGKKFGNITGLKNHAKLHTVRERNFFCMHEGCGKAFLRKQDLKRHETTHLENYHPYACGNCGTTFTRSDALSRHLKARRCMERE